MTLKELKIGETATIVSVGGSGSLRQHFLDMGVIPNAQVTLIKMAPMGDPMELRIHGYELTLRVADAEKIEIENVRVADDGHSVPEEGGARKIVDHPGLGEKGAFHSFSPSSMRERHQHRMERHHYSQHRERHHFRDGNPLPPGTQLTFALAGNQNCGKTTLFNQLTGSNQHVGNFPGVTVDRKDGVIKGYPNTLVTDLPGIYSLSPYSNEELVTRKFILEDRPKGIINIVDATNIERNLYLTMQLMELDVPMVLALNMMDEVSANGGSILVNEMELRLGIPVIPISASKNQGIDELVDHAINVARNEERPGRTDFCDPQDHDGAVHRCLHAIMHLVEDHARNAGIPIRFAAAKLAEGDSHILEQLLLDDNEKEMLEHLLKQMEEERGMDRSAAIADMRYEFINKICSRTVIKPRESREHIRSRKMDKVLTGKWSAIPAFVAIMCVVFWLTFGVIGEWLSGLLDDGIGWLTQIADTGLTLYGINPVVQSLVVDGIFAGVGSVLSFLPYIVTLFFFLSILEDSGYMARVAFVMDKLLRKIGLSGRSIVPMLVGFGCTVPGIMASRTLPSERDRKMTILLTPYMSCSAKLPIFALLSAAFFPGHATLAMICLYFLGIIMGIVVALGLRGTLFRGSPVPFVMELPNYRMPGGKNVWHLLWEKAKDFITRAFTVIFIATIVIWCLQTFDLKLNVVADSQNSLLAKLAGLISPVFGPLGFADWKISTALITGFMAKESVVSTLTVLVGATPAALSSLMTPLAAAVFLVFVLLYTPCVAAISSVRRELGGRWAMFVVVGQCVLAWVVAYGVHLIGTMLGFA